MDINLQITDMAGASHEHSLIIVNFVSTIRKQLKDSTCYVFSDIFQNTITEKNKDELKLIHFPDVKITFDELFEEIEL